MPTGSRMSWFAEKEQRGIEPYSISRRLRQFALPVVQHQPLHPTIANLGVAQMILAPSEQHASSGVWAGLRRHRGRTGLAWRQVLLSAASVRGATQSADDGIRPRPAFTCR